MRWASSASGPTAAPIADAALNSIATTVDALFPVPLIFDAFLLANAQLPSRQFLPLVPGVGKRMNRKRFDKKSR
jgi:hypothetical protein